MYQNLEHKKVTAKKDHVCDYCGRTIHKSEKYDYSRFIFDVDFYEWRCHLACDRVASAIWDYVDPDEGMSDQEFTDGCQEICQRFICPECPRWNKEYDDCEDDETYCIDRMDEFFETHELYREGRQGWYEVWKVKKKGKDEKGGALTK